MAKPIRATPRLSGDDALKFIKRMILLEKSQINSKDKEFAEQIKKNSIFFKVY